MTISNVTGNLDTETKVLKPSNIPQNPNTDCNDIKLHTTLEIKYNYNTHTPSFK